MAEKAERRVEPESCPIWRMIPKTQVSLERDPTLSCHRQRAATMLCSFHVPKANIRCCCGHLVGDPSTRRLRHSSFEESQEISPWSHKAGEVLGALCAGFDSLLDVRKVGVDKKKRRCITSLILTWFNVTQKRHDNPGG